MPLTFEPFVPADVANLGSFDCGDTLGGRMATEWIFCRNDQNSASTSIQRGTRVWLYRDDTGNIVGFGSLGPTSRQIAGFTPPIAVIPQFGVDVRFHQMPAGSEWRDRYSAQIFSDLLCKARELGYRSVFLLVHKDNHAINLYRKFGFVDAGTPPKHDYLPMIVKLPEVQP
jgi:ribosomal protein S18 acetylase RimI-like enzyme